MISAINLASLIRAGINEALLKEDITHCRHFSIFSLKKYFVSGRLYTWSKKGVSPPHSLLFLEGINESWLLFLKDFVEDVFAGRTGV